MATEKTVNANSTNPILEIETNYDVASIISRGEQVWPVLRILYFFQIRNLENGSDQSLGMDNTARKIQLAAQMLKGFWRWFKPLDVMVFSDSSEDREIDGRRQNKLFAPLFEILKNKRITYVERVGVSQGTALPSGHPPTVSASLIHFASAVLARCLPMPAIENEHLLLQIKQRYKIRVNDARAIRLFFAYRVCFRFLLRFKKPQAVFVSDYYNLLHMALMVECRQAGIASIEFQHGVANREHPAYNFYARQLESKVTPSLFFAFGRMVIDEIAAAPFIEISRVRLTGHPYLDYLKRRGPPISSGEFTKSGSPRAPLKAPHEAFETVIGVTLQWTDEDQVIDFMNAVAARNPQLKIVLIPRNPGLPKYGNLKLEPNVVVERALDFYSTLWFMDVHVTTYSTCALEAPIFGVPNILINTGEMALRYFGRQLTDPGFTRYVHTVEEFESALRTGFLDRAEIERRSESLFTVDHPRALRAALSEITALKL